MRDTNSYVMSKKQREEAYEILAAIPAKQMTLSMRPIPTKQKAVRVFFREDCVTRLEIDLTKKAAPKMWLSMHPTFAEKARRNIRKQSTTQDWDSPFGRDELLSTVAETLFADACLVPRAENSYYERNIFDDEFLGGNDKALVLYRILRSLRYTHDDAVARMRDDLNGWGEKIVTTFDAVK